MAGNSREPSMADLKHRMLYQGQDPSQPVTQLLRPLSQDPPISEPPAYDDAVENETMTMRNNQGNNQQTHLDRRRTFFAEPQHLRSQREPQPIQLLHELDEQQSAQQQQQQQQQQLEGQQQLMLPKVRSFFALAQQPKFGLKACVVVCPACGQQGRTRLLRTANTRTHAWALWLCSFGWCCCACLYPYLMDSCRTTSHYCNACKTFLGAYYPKDCCH